MKQCSDSETEQLNWTACVGVTVLIGDTVAHGDRTQGNTGFWKLIGPVSQNCNRAWVSGVENSDPKKVVGVENLEQNVG